jgi:hypothetical protein
MVSFIRIPFLQGGPVKTLCCYCAVFAAGFALVLSCTNPAQPVDTTNSVWYKVVSPKTVPDTLYYGQSSTFQVAIGDSDGDAVRATVTGLPQGSYNITSDGDTAFVTMNLTADSLQYDSLYTVRIRARGGAAVDSLSLSYSFLVVDSSRIGGLRKLVTGSWWITDENDSLVYVKDTAGIRVTVAKNDRHHKYSKVTFAGIIAGNQYYGIETTDTILSDSSQPSKSGIVLRHTAAKVDYTVPPKLFVVNRDSVDVVMLNLPLAVHNSWQVFSVSGDTAVRIYIGTFPLVIGVQLQLYLSESGSAQVAGTSQYEFGGAARTCYEVVSQNNMKADYVSDTAIAYLGTAIINVGDTAVASDSVCVVHSFVNNDLSIPLWSYSQGSKRDTNYVNNVVTRDTVRTASYLTMYFDARTGKMLVK